MLNVGSGAPHTINDLTTLLGGDVVHIPERPGEPDCTFADTRKIQRLLDWQPRVSFEEGVGIMVDNIDQWGNAPVWEKESISEATKDWFRYLGDPSEGGLIAKHE